MVEYSASKRPDPKEYLHMKQIYYYSLTIAWFIVVVILSIVVGDVSVFFGVIGSTVAWFMVLLGPGSFYIITVHKKKVKFDSWMSIFFYAAAWIISFFGALGMIGLNIWVIIQSIK